jgi:hypothetical protein
MRTKATLALILCLSLMSTPLALGHAEREVEFPPGDGEIPEYRPFDPDADNLVVCKSESAGLIDDIQDTGLRAFNQMLLAQCAHAHIQAAIDAVEAPGTNIYVLPGTYLEEPSLAPPTPECQDVQALMDQEGRNFLSYEETVLCPHMQNLIAILGDDPDDDDRSCTTERLCRLQIEGTGESPEDVTIDNAWNKLNGLRADRADGFYLKNVLVQRAEFNSVYVLEQDGFVLDNIITRWNWEYGILVFAVDHGLIKDCEAYGNGDAGLYPGSASDLKGARWAVEITRCQSYNNMAGYSGTAGNSVYAHNNTFRNNAVGVVMDSLFPDHPGLPQDSSWFENNLIHSNNENYYDNYLGEDAPCHRDIPDIGIEDGVVCPIAPVPVGTGMMIAGGNNNTFTQNWIYDNHRYGTILFPIPSILRDETDPFLQLDTSHDNRQIGNFMGFSPDMEIHKNGLDFWWAEGGAGNCWQDNIAPDGPTSEPPAFLLPRCNSPLVDIYRPPNAIRIAEIAPCALYDKHDNTHPVGCDWMNDP